MYNYEKQKTYPNQRIITIHKDPVKENFLQVNICEWQEAFATLPRISFGLYLYLCGNQDKFHLALSSVDVQKSLGSITVDCRSGEIDPMSQAFIQMSGIFAELELSILRARVKSGMANAKAKGQRIGRPKTTKDDIPPAFYKHYPAFMNGKMNVSELARVCGLSRPTVYKYMKMMG